MKKIISFALVLIMMFSLLCACDSSQENQQSETQNENSSLGETDNSQGGEQNGNENGNDNGNENGGEEGDEQNSQITYPSAEVPKTLKVLAIGNSFSVDAMEYLYQIAKDAGVKTVVLGNLRVSGCTINMHHEYMTNDTAAYTYLKNTTGTWTSKDGYKLLEGLKDEKWDIITLQQGSHESGLTQTYRKLNSLCDYVKENATNPDVKLYWHMTWAYKEGCTHKEFPKYGSSQMQMYKMIAATVQERIVDNTRFSGIIPSGTAVQNVRTSFLGDNINRDDGYHMAQPMGRYLIGLTYFAALTGADISGITYTPSSSASKELIDMFKECVTNAMNNKFEVTESAYKAVESGSVPELKGDDVIANAIGVDLSKYTQLEFEYYENKYWHSKEKTSGPKDSSSSQDGKFICTQTKYTKEQLLNAVIICDTGWQYRPERWKSANVVATERPDNVSEAAVLLDESWWGSDNYLALNISKVSGEKISSDYAAAATHVRIYIPNN